MATDAHPQTIEQASALGDLPRVQEWIRSLSIHRGTALEDSMVQRLQSSLCEAARHSRAAIVSCLLDQGLEIRDDVLKAARDGQSADVFQALLDHGWNINSTILAGSTSLCLNLGNADMVRWHLEHGADPNLETRRGFTALDYAGYQYSLDTVQVLVDHGADISTTTAIHGAVANSSKFNALYPGRLDVVEFLLKRGADINQLESVRERPGRPPITIYTGTPLHRAVEGERSDHVEFLLRRGADRNIKGPMGLTPLMVSDKDGLDEIAALLRKNSDSV